ncbi:SUKH-3 domain-containing protein [Nonomuraea sp. NPDC046802]|uniref:SUKH-3 domain-containing protein n=1 Tax=Nonomuraea sp. NPDC046802 TaxID=3154919 RepID=UPI0033FCA0E0
MGRTLLEAETVEKLTEAGWQPGRNIGDQVDRWVEEIRAIHQRRNLQAGPGFSDDLRYAEPPSAVLDMLREFGGLDVNVTGPGRTMRKHPFQLDPRIGLLSPRAYAQLSDLAGSVAFPIGILHGDGAALAGDERGRVLLIGSAGEMLVGTDIHEGLNNLVQGVMPSYL